LRATGQRAFALEQAQDSGPEQPPELLAGRHARAALTLACALALALPAFGADNQATGDIAGNPAALTDSNVVSLSSSGVQLTLVKRAFLADGTVVPDTSTVPAGTRLKFLIYVSNPTSLDVHDLNVRDVLDPAFVYQSPSIKVDASQSACAGAVCTPAEEDALFLAVDARSVLTDAVDADVASFDSGGPKVDAGSVAGNATVVVPANRVWAVQFTVQLP
jgi:hypothetical protein